MIEVENLRKTYPTHDGEKVAVDGVSIEVAEGEFFTLLGPSGCGKTTTLRCIAGLERPDSGVIRIGRDEVFRDRVLVPTHDRDLGMVFQSYAVWPHMSVFDNVAFPLTVARDRPGRGEIRQRVGQALAMVGLEGLESRMSTQLSGGQQQRLSVARALVRNPKVLLLDEPLSNLDAKLRERMRAELRQIQQRVGITTIFVTHDQVEALSMSDRVAVMRDGRVEQLGTPQEVYHRPASPFVAHFIGGTNLLDGEVVEEGGPGLVAVLTSVGIITGTTAAALRAGTKVVCAARLEDVQLRDSGSTVHPGETRLEGRIRLGLFNGSSVDYVVDVGDVQFQVRTGSRRVFGAGHLVDVVLSAEWVNVLTAGGEGNPTPVERAAPVTQG